ncbi:hypothetical protein NBO_4g0070 [Nosema bombycis CQ1]|uniref:Uncharacterized protein n=1 Tax=Nosema bombycis (strain CQ1 / CVCC 102059) TaxID=578461 RepID=R0KZ32_NOSB1|nr:hypothetical protein NBO_4g0070 [Nosema bombycis CQ1]|eukprot:EOB15442.1 hypothetical protein NBO_4g0070 [Nosema bombycis CQ1]
MDLKSQIVTELHGTKRHTILNQVDYDFGPLEEISTIDLPFLTIPFLNGRVYYNFNNKKESLDCFLEFKSLLEGLGLISPVLKAACSSRAREDKIKIYNLKRSFTYHFIDWEDREWVIKLLEYFYILSSEEIYFLKEEKNLPKSSDQKEIKHFEVIKIGNKSEYKSEMVDLNREGLITAPQPKPQSTAASQPNFFIEHTLLDKTTVKFNRKDLLKRRINPKYTLEDFGDVIAERLKKLEEMPKIKPDIKEKTLKEIREKDEEKDEKHVNKGNTERMG